MSPTTTGSRLVGSLLIGPFLVSPLLVLAPASAQDSDKNKAFLQRYKVEITFPYVKKGGWNLDWDEVRKLAAAKDKLIFAFFTRSDKYSNPCKYVQDRLLSDPRIRDFTETVVPFLHVTSRINGRKYDELHSNLGFEEFPVLCFINAKGSVLYRLRITDLTIEGFINRRNDVARILELEQTADEDADDAKELLFLRFKMGNIDFDEAESLGAKSKMTKEERKDYEAKLVETMTRMSRTEAHDVLESAEFTKEQKMRAVEIVIDLEIEEAMEPLMRGFQPGQIPPYHICYDLYKERKLPSRKSEAWNTFWVSVANIACDKSDEETLTEAIGVFKSGDSNSAYLTILENKLATIKKASSKKKKKKQKPAKDESKTAGPGRD